MTSSAIGQRERVVLLAVAALLAAAVVWWRGSLQPAAPLERLARQSLDLQEALSNGRPTLVEFYADWCEACRAMAPAMEAAEREHRGQLDVVMLNVDNPRWRPEVDMYEVNGIPQLELFNADGQPVGRSIGARSAMELQQLTGALLAGEPLPALAGMGPVSRLEDGDGRNTAEAATMAAPRSHG